MLPHLTIYRTLEPLIKHRKGEIKLGERLQFINETNWDNIWNMSKKGVRFGILGIPESVGVQANSGRPGAELAWEQFAIQFANLQSNRYLEGSDVLFLGQVVTKDLQQRAMELSPGDSQYYTKLRSLCQELDNRVAPIVEVLVKAELVPIIIGGGHNNSFPILKAISQELGFPQGIACLNCDAHADFRPLEGRHSGNGFSYAFYQGFLQRYFVLGLHEQANSEAMLKNMDLEPQVSYSLRDQIGSMGKALEEALNFIERSPLPTGLELDLDAVSLMPASAITVQGISIDEAREYICKGTAALAPAYLHLPEAAIINAHTDPLLVGKTLACLVTDFIKNYP